MTSLIEAGDAPGSKKVAPQSCDSPEHTIHTLCSCNTTCSTQYVCVSEKKNTHTHTYDSVFDLLTCYFSLSPYCHLSVFIVLQSGVFPTACKDLRYITDHHNEMGR